MHKFEGAAICWQTLPPPALPEKYSFSVSALCGSVPISLSLGSIFLCFLLCFSQVLPENLDFTGLWGTRVRPWSVLKPGTAQGSVAQQVINTAFKSSYASQNLKAWVLEWLTAPRCCWLRRGAMGAHCVCKMRPAGRVPEWMIWKNLVEPHVAWWEYVLFLSVLLCKCCVYFYRKEGEELS